MKSIRLTVLTAILATAGMLAFAADDADHASHHPESASATASAKSAPKAVSKNVVKAGTPKAAAMDMQMKAMSEMHEKMMNAKTPEERSALMAEHMKTMQKSMSMMNGMMGSEASGKKVSPEMMRKQVDMMQMMTDMMKDRMEAPPAPAK